MDMKVDARRIKAERERRAWSQEHLAAAAGLGLRTIQRIERTGAASLESAKALAAVFALDVAVLRAGDACDSRAAAQGPTGRKRARWLRPVLGGAAAALVAAVLLLAEPGRADEVMLDVGISLDDAPVSQSRLATDTGVAAEVVVQDLLRLSLEPTLTDDGKIRLAAQIFRFHDGRFELVSSPILVTVDGKEAEIRLVSDDGSVLRMLLTPYHRVRPKALEGI